MCAAAAAELLTIDTCTSKRTVWRIIDIPPHCRLFALLNFQSVLYNCSGGGLFSVSSSSSSFESTLNLLLAVSFITLLWWLLCACEAW